MMLQLIHCSIFMTSVIIKLADAELPKVLELIAVKMCAAVRIPLDHFGPSLLLLLSVEGMKVLNERM